ncbi:Hypothetical protein PHPALM_38170 [Phytophthora palmivora]|uniref:Uncharacterized protein n=1 Tax=Phytophthora palmivora TaxID=4796 RepID=A0A2P4WVK3_9STRA|nr:Hypothetical protein PHPALM_38170 [Phytophthora palmivora]
MSRPTTRREITPLHVPWLQHEQFPATKQACSSQDGLVSGSKNGLLKVVQELKRGRANVDKQLAQLDAQLLAITDYVDGKSSNMFPPHLVTVVEDTPNVTASTSVTDGRRHYGAGVAGKYSGIFKSESTPPTPGMVEEDLNSDTPCTTTGLWKYVYAYSFFKVVTPEDMEQVLLLEGKDKVLGALDIQRLQEKLSLSKYAPQYLDDFFKEVRLEVLCNG